MTRFRFAPIPAALPATVPFTGPETLEARRGAPFRARLGANENGFGPSPRAIAAMARAAGEVWKYGDPDSHDLRHALADEGIFARMPGVAPMDRCIRVSCGPEAELAAFADALPRALRAAD